MSPNKVFTGLLLSNASRVGKDHQIHTEHFPETNAQPATNTINTHTALNPKKQQTPRNAPPAPAVAESIYKEGPRQSSSYA
ncbi:MAG: hypothetical protein ACM3UY_00130 [Methanocella sp.]